MVQLSRLYLDTKTQCFLEALRPLAAPSAALETSLCLGIYKLIIKKKLERPLFKEGGAMKDTKQHQSVQIHTAMFITLDV